MKTKEIIDYLDSRFRPELQEDYDNSGFLLGDEESEYHGALVALDLTPEVVDEAIACGLNLIVTHHPFIFRGLKRLTSRQPEGRLVQQLIKNDIAVYAAHTNLDNLPWGVNGILCEKLGLSNCHILKPIASDSEAGAGMVGELEQAVPLKDYLQQVKQVLGLPALRYAGGSGRVHRVALCGGAGSFLIADAVAAQADLYLTADLKYHDFQQATSRMALADVGHYESEQFAKEIIFHAISEKFSNFALRISERQQSIARFI